MGGMGLILVCKKNSTVLFIISMSLFLNVVLYFAIIVYSLYLFYLNIQWLMSLASSEEGSSWELFWNSLKHFCLFTLLILVWVALIGRSYITTVLSFIKPKQNEEKFNEEEESFSEEEESFSEEEEESFSEENEESFSEEEEENFSEEEENFSKEEESN